MKKNILNIKTLAALLMAGAAFTACSNEDTIIEEQPVNPAEKTYTLTIEALKSDEAMTRALSLDNSGNINATWSKDDVVEVYIMNQWDTPVGTLKPTTNGNGTTVLTGTISGNFTAGSTHLNLFLNGYKFDYTGQKGVLESPVDPIYSISKKYDYAFAPNGSQTLIITQVDNDNKTIKVETNDNKPVQFSSYQAIVKFTLKDKADKPIYTSRFEIKTEQGHENMIEVKEGGNGTLIINPATPTNELYVAIRCRDQTNTAESYTFTAYGEDQYTLTKTNYKNSRNYLFEPGKYYEVTLKMKATEWTELNLGTSQALDNNSNMYTVQNNTVITGTLGTTKGIYIADGATVKLKNVTIPSQTKSYAGITCNGNATIILEGTNNVTGGISSSDSHAYPGIQVIPGATLTIRGNGTLNVTGGGELAAGIGSCDYSNGNSLTNNAGNIVIQGGTINATGGAGAPGIGAGSGSCGNITIEAGDVTAIAGKVLLQHAGYDYYPAAIGTNGVSSSCGNIAITGGKVTAKPSENDGLITVIGGAGNTSCPSITIGTGTTRVSMWSGDINTLKTTMPIYYMLKATTVKIGSTSITGSETVDNVANNTTIMSEFPKTTAYDKNNGTNFDCRLIIER